MLNSFGNADDLERERIKGILLVLLGRTETVLEDLSGEKRKNQELVERAVKAEEKLVSKMSVH